MSISLNTVWILIKVFSPTHNNNNLSKFGIKGNSDSDGKGKWSEMVWACVKEG